MHILKFFALSIIALFVIWQFNNYTSSYPNTGLERNIYYFITPQGKLTLNLQEARTQRDLAKGLSKIHHLPADEGMLFIFDKPQQLRFWMKDTYIPLDIIYLNENMEIGEIHSPTTPLSLEGINSKAPYMYTLELNMGMAKDYDLKIGQKLHRQTP